MKSAKLYCSRSCAAIVNNSIFPKRETVTAQCAHCNKNFKGNKIYCSVKCKNESQIISGEEIGSKIKEFYEKEGRIPFKKEFLHYNAARDRFGNWNSAVAAVGFNPNPIKFARKYFAVDGHTCDSLAEKIIDDWLHKRGVRHERNIRYPNEQRLTVDFVTANHWIEFFGLAGEVKEYDLLIERKQKLAKKYNLPLIEIYPKDLFPINKLWKKF